jgi:hypothetical protein
MQVICIPEEEFEELKREQSLQIEPISLDLKTKKEGQMKEEQVTNNNQPIKDKLLSLHIKRTMEGVEIFVKSKIIEDFFSGISEGRTSASDNSGWEGKKSYNPYTLPKVDSDANSLSKWGYPLIENGIYYNISFLRAVGLSQGVTFNFPGLFTEEYIRKLAEYTKQMTRRLYNQYIRNCEITLEMSIKETY